MAIHNSAGILFLSDKRVVVDRLLIAYGECTVLLKS
jgi:hypothetical protein